MSKDIDAILSAAKLPEKTVEICLRGDLVAEHEEYERLLREEERKVETDDRMVGSAEVRRLAQEVESLEQQMKDATVTFYLRALHRAKWVELVQAHQPAEEDDDTTKAVGFKAETFFPAIIRACTVKPELTDNQWARLLGGEVVEDDGTKTEVEGVLTSRQFDNLGNTAWNLNRRDVDVPFSYSASELLQASEQR